jgi:predicted dehydrogenase
MQPRATARIGLIGCGLWGANILRDLQGLGATTFVVDVDPSARERAMQAGAASAVGEADELTGIEGWIVATPARTHLRSIETVAGHGAPILCEKPLTTSLDEARAISAMLQGPLHLMDVWRYHPAVERVKQIVASGELGQVHGLHSVRANWTSPRVDVDTIWNLAPHEISIYRELFDAYPEPVAALAERIDGQARSLWGHWSARPWMVSELSNRRSTRRRELRLHCERGVALFNGDVPGVIEIASGAADENLEASERRIVTLESETALQRQLSAWLGFLAGGEAPRSDLEHATRVVALVEKVRTLAGLGR